MLPVINARRAKRVTIAPRIVPGGEPAAVITR